MFPIVLRRALILSLLLATAVGSSRATLVLHRTLPQLGSDADVVAQGVVQSVTPFWNQDHTRVLTAVDVQVERAYKGQPNTVVRIVQMGGVLDGVRMTVAGALRWVPGEEVLVFLESSRRDYRVAGFTQGRFDLERDPVTRRVYAARGGAADARFVNARGGSAASGAVKVPLDELLAEALPQRDGGK
jgi:hypothetical protein